MAKQFELQLIGTEMSKGELDADCLLAIVQSLKEVATRIGRIETSAEPLGRAPQRTQRVARLTIGLGSVGTALRVRRTGVPDALDFESAEERAFDEKFAQLIEGVAANRRPAWTSDSLGVAAANLIAALRHTAAEVRFTVDGRVRATFDAVAARRDLWHVPPTLGPCDYTLIGRLYSANLILHRLMVEDALGQHIALPSVADDVEVSRLLDEVVIVTGVPEYNALGRLVAIRAAKITASPNPFEELSREESDEDAQVERPRGVAYLGMSIPRDMTALRLEIT